MGDLECKIGNIDMPPMDEAALLLIHAIELGRSREFTHLCFPKLTQAF
jgi:hypothetical protein